MFSRCLVINLDRRPERWGAFQAALPKDWPFPEPERWSAFDEHQAGHEAPLYWTQCRGSWGCFQSHIAVLRWILDNYLDKVLVLEDDCVWCPDFSDRACEFLGYLPGDWGQLYFGGEHLNQNRGLPRQVNEACLRVFNVNRTHAYAVRADYADFALRYFTKRPHNKHVDYIFGEIHQKAFFPVYAPKRWIVGQAKGASDVAKNVNGRESLMKEESWWNRFQYLDLAGNKQMMR